MSSPRKPAPSPLEPLRLSCDGHDLDPVLAFMQQLWTIDQGMRAISAEMQSRIGITGPERLILRMVGQCPGISAGQLARLLRRHPSTLTSALDRLIRRRMLSGKVDEGDRRRLVLTLTSSGRRVDRLNSGTVEASMRRALANVSTEALSVTSRVLAVIEGELMAAQDDLEDTDAQPPARSTKHRRRPRDGQPDRAYSGK